MGLLLGIILGLFVLVVLVVLHELGHAIVARRNGVEVEEFGVGFPPRAWGKKLKNGILLTLNWLPLGGFVKLKGEHDSARGKGTYGQASFWVKTKILLAGVAINWLTAALLFAVISLWGLPKLLSHQVVLPFDNRVERSQLLIASVSDGSPAERAGLAVGDHVLSLDEEEVATAEQLVQMTRERAGEDVSVLFERDGSMKSVEVQLNTDEEARSGGYLGVGPHQTESVHATWSAPILGVATAGQLTYETVKGVGTLLGQAVGGFFGQFFGDESSRQDARDNLAQAGEGVAGPIGILAVIFPSVLDAGFTQILLLTAVISLTLAVMNILPIPALDGGRWFTMAIFRLLRKELTKDREETIQAIGFLVLIGLIIIVTWSDIGKFF